MRIYIHTVFFQNPLYECMFSDAKCKTISYQSMITTPSARSIPCALGSCPAHGLGHPVILSFGSKVKVVCAHINHILCADTVSSAGDSHEQFPRSRSTHKRKKGLELVTAIMTQSFIKSNYEQPQTVAIKS